ncbi:uncharacterized protein LOC106466453 [Limulus polyphemus]|uniref:Uncharacterized protein LOC106466453 n=1 Tax=Limulus polyphemus TaxID=6850 RepID=A0ABM1T2Q5_LIMPO|nr:uncharacterized protein LOC106466453 [Limulus polyphemus]
MYICFKFNLNFKLQWKRCHMYKVSVSNLAKMGSRATPKCKRSTVSVLFHRELGKSKCSVSAHHVLQVVAEDKAATSEQEEMHCKLPSSVRSTFLTAFSPDGTKVASTHGDHKIYMCDVKTGRLVHVLEGHPRTPWCLAFHPSSNEILASGCLGGEVRVWDLHGGSEVWVADQNTVITSLAFHPLDRVLVIATFNKIHFWDWSRPVPFATCITSSDREKVRFVKFNPLGTKLITGISNLPVDSFRSHIMDSVLSQNNSPSFSQNSTSQRRSILTRLMTMYRHLEGLEELSQFQESRGRVSPTQEDALESAREYAEEVTTRFLRQRYRADEILGAREEEDEFPVEGEQPRNLAVHQPSTSAGGRYEGTRSQTNEFRATVQRLSSICARLERRMFEQQFLHLQGNTESLVSSSTTPADSSQRETEEFPQTSRQSSILDPRGHPLLHREMTTQLGQEFSLSLADLLRRLQNSLQNLSQTTFASSETWEQIQQVFVNFYAIELNVKHSMVIPSGELLDGFMEHLISTEPVATGNVECQIMVASIEMAKDEVAEVETLEDTVEEETMVGPINSGLPTALNKE